MPTLAKRPAEGPGPIANESRPLERFSPHDVGVVTETMPRARHTILLVDDNALTRMAAALLLKDLGHHVIETRSGAEALAVLGTGSAVDLIITDQLMPGMTGGELAAAAHALQPDLPVVVSTGYGRMPDDGTADLPRLDKPYDREDLTATITRVMADRKPTS